MKRLLAIGIVFAAWAAGVPAEAMPLGMRVAMWGVAVSRDRDGGLADALDAPGLEFTTGGDAGWTAQGETAHGGGSALKSGAIGDGQVSWVETSVDGAGEVSFWWKASSEHYRQYAIDYAMFSVDGQERLRIGGEQDWTNATVQVEGAGTHVLRWSYVKDDEMSGGSDCAWLDEVTWTPTSGLAAWLAERNLTADAVAANGRTAAECYMLGLDPALATNDFRIVSIELVDGEPKVEWEPKVNRWTGAELNAVLKGAPTLDGPWEDVPEGGSPGRLAPPLTARPTMRFFKVVVELP